MGGTDYSVQDSAQATGTVTSSANTVTATTSIFTAQMVGNYITDGTTWKEITAFTSATVVTVDSGPSWTAATIKVGGGLASIGGAGKAGVIFGNTIYIKAGTYTISSATINVSGGAYNSSNNLLWVGYSTNRTTTNTDTPPVLQFGTSGITLFADRGTHYNITIDGNSQATSVAVGGSGGAYDLCTFKNLTGASAAFSASRCLITGCSALICQGPAFGCEAYGNTATPWQNGPFAFCLSYNNTGASTDGFLLNPSGGVAVMNCVAYGNGRDGFHVQNSRGVLLLNCHAEANSGYGYNSGGNSSVILLNCGSYSNTSGRFNTTSANVDNNPLTLSGSAFVNAAGNNFSINNTAGAGALLRAMGFPGVFPRGTTTGYLDVGAAQHQDPAGSISYFPVVRQSIREEVSEMIYTS